jgi:hypothetical protein
MGKLNSTLRSSASFTLASCPAKESTKHSAPLGNSQSLTFGKKLQEIKNPLLSHDQPDRPKMQKHNSRIARYRSSVIQTSTNNEEWNTGKTRETLDARILAFLMKSKKPFTIIGIMNGVGYNTKIEDFRTLFSGITNANAVQNALEKLIREGKVTAKIIKQPDELQTYYLAV